MDGVEEDHSGNSGIGQGFVCFLSRHRLLTCWARVYFPVCILQPPTYYTEPESYPVNHAYLPISISHTQLGKRP
jgi:hypothetical protein